MQAKAERAKADAVALEQQAVLINGPIRINGLIIQGPIRINGLTDSNSNKRTYQAKAERAKAEAIALEQQVPHPHSKPSPKRAGLCVYLSSNRCVFEMNTPPTGGGRPRHD